MTHPLVQAVRAALQTHADPVKARQMQAYMKSSMPFYGVAAPQQRRIWREVSAANPIDSCDELRAVALTLWREATFREERYAAIALTDLRRYAACQDLAAMPMYEEMIVTGAWWDYVDAIATHHVGNVLRKTPRQMKPLMRRWARDRTSMWKRRAAILSQIGFKTETDVDLLFETIEPNLSHQDFFIRKAIGWALRQYAWVDAREVQRFVDANRARLSPLSVREALKNVTAIAARA